MISDVKYHAVLATHLEVEVILNVQELLMSKAKEETKMTKYFFGPLLATWRQNEEGT